MMRRTMDVASSICRRGNNARNRRRDVKPNVLRDYDNVIVLSPNQQRDRDGPAMTVLVTMVLMVTTSATM